MMMLTTGITTTSRMLSVFACEHDYDQKEMQR